MKLKFLSFLTFITLILFTFAMAQPCGKITGSVLDEAKKPFDGATVILLAAKDSTVVSSQLVNRDGSFAFQNLKDNIYQIRATYIGFKNYQSSKVVVRGQKPVDLPAFILSQAG